MDAVSLGLKLGVNMSKDTLLAGRYSAFLFDMDGTVLNSIASAERVWGAWAKRQGLDVEAFLPTIHGARSVDTIAALKIPGLDPAVEAHGITQDEIKTAEGIVEISGAIRFLKALPTDRWAIVTSAPRALAEARIRAAGLPVPPLLIAAEDVTAGKPDPQGYRLAAQKLGVDIADCLVFEDAAVGIEAGHAAGAHVVIITETHNHPLGHPLTSVHPQIPAYADLTPHIDTDGYIRLAA
jgi:sugar-phosphatase